MIQHLIPPIIPKPIPPLPLRIHRLNPRCAKRTRTLRQFNHPLLVLRRNGLLHDLFDLVFGKDAFQRFDDTLWFRNVDAFTPVADAECWEGLLEFFGRVVVFYPCCYADRLSTINL